MKRTIPRYVLTFTALMVVVTTSSVVTAQEFDIVILGGRVMDPETKFDGVRNVGIKDGWIATITEAAIEGKETIDATNHVVAPGFIDTHTHSSNKYCIKMSMMDGVTSGMDFEGGAMNIADWYAREKGKWPMNYGQVVGHEMARMVVHDGIKLDGPIDTTDMFDLRAESGKDGVLGWSVTVSDLDQINEINRILDENLRQGALGIGGTPGYASTGISTYEQFETQRTAARYGRISAFHTRFHVGSKPPQEAPMGFAEVFTNACLLKAPLLICHDNDYGWWEIEEKLAMAREMGMNMWAEYYPYAAASTSIGSDGVKPEFIEGVLGLKYSDMLYDPTQDKYLNKAEYLKVAKEDPGRTIVAFNPPRYEWMKSWIKMPHMVVASDSMWSTNPDLTWDSDPSKFKGHPRTSGAHTKVLRMGREAGVPLNFTLAQLSYWTAMHLGDAGIEFMKTRGRMQEGTVADIVVFDPKNVKEGSDYKAGKQGLPPIGLPHVIVNGRFVKRDNKATNVFPGLPIRYPVEEKGRFIPASKKQWLRTFTIDSSPLAPKAKPTTKKAGDNQSSLFRGKPADAEASSGATIDPSVAKHGWWGDHRYHTLGNCCDKHQSIEATSTEPVRTAGRVHILGRQIKTKLASTAPAK